MKSDILAEELLLVTQMIISKLRIGIITGNAFRTDNFLLGVMLWCEKKCSTEQLIIL